ncbi:glycosyltransferase family 1 protein [uncultured Bacteroides sp.]|jgi:uncharacterized protein yefI|uniref:glycosyltransferase family 4 protein n=1 Tax=uncultured Bacteroides sp. TaxID=162156 RepID=UPI00280B84FF|nr:glycosyltransferase family 1 protein [uncultured Bacteroides sp.]
MRTIVVSAVNLRKGGTLTILHNCLEYLSRLAQTEPYKVVALVHKKELVPYPGIEYIELPWTLRSWYLRLWCEYVTMYRISQKLKPVYLWLSLHDTTPNVEAERRAVYCHNPFPFYQWKWKELFLNYRIVCFAWFSKYIYRVNIHKNYRILVQQQWIRKRFMEMFHLPGERIVVTLPTAPPSLTKGQIGVGSSSVYQFLFPSYCDIHKNFELLCQATALLEKEIGKGKFRVLLTITGTENKYTQWLYRKWGYVKSLDFAGFMSRDELYMTYEKTDCLVFPSKIETWGLPISEFARFGKPMLLADLPYAHETAMGSRQTAFFNVQDAGELKELMKRLILNDTVFLTTVPKQKIPNPITGTWRELFDELLK